MNEDITKGFFKHKKSEAFLGFEKAGAFSKNLNDLMEFPKDGIFSKVLSKSDSYNFTLMCLSKGTDIDTHTSSKNGGIVSDLRGGYCCTMR